MSKKRIINIILVVAITIGIVTLVQRSGPRLSYEPVVIDTILHLDVVAADTIRHEAMHALIEPYRDKLRSTMDEVIGTCADTYPVDWPETPLTRLVAEMMMNCASSIAPVDAAISNIGGIRAPLEKGDITVGDVYQVLPFDNALVVLQMRGTTLDSLVAEIARKGGAAVAGLSFAISPDSVALDPTVAGRSIDPDRIYYIATNDYLSWGNDGFPSMANFVTSQAANITLRDAMLQYVIKETASGRTVVAPTKENITMMK